MAQGAGGEAGSLLHSARCNLHARIYKVVKTIDPFDFQMFLVGILVFLDVSTGCYALRNKKSQLRSTSASKNWSGKAHMSVVARVQSNPFTAGNIKIAPRDRGGEGAQLCFPGVYLAKGTLCSFVPRLHGGRACLGERLFLLLVRSGVLSRNISSASNVTK